MDNIIECFVCKNKINQNEEFDYEINLGTNQSYYCCESCHDQMWEDNKITNCVACGNWFEVKILKSDESPVGGDTFTACPYCGRDIVDGETRKDRINNK